MLNLIEKLRNQLAALEAPPENFSVEKFLVWYISKSDEKLLKPVRVEHNSWSWGFCQDERCAHHSHDPYDEGDTVYITCRPIGEDEYANPMFQTPNGVVFSYRYVQDHGLHYAPTARIRILE